MPVTKDGKLVHRVLVIDEREESLDEIYRHCANAGHDAIGCSSIAEAFQFLETKDHVDVVVTEAFLREESVFDFLRQLRNTNLHQGVPILVLASNFGELGEFCMPTVELSAKVMGAYKFLVMPEFDAHQLIREIAAALPDHQVN